MSLIFRRILMYTFVYRKHSISPMKLEIRCGKLSIILNDQFQNVVDCHGDLQMGSN